MTNETVTAAIIDCELIGVDGNAFSLMGHWKQCAQQQGVESEDISKVLELAQAGDYDNLIGVLFRHCN